MEKVKTLMNESPAARWIALLLVSFTMMANYWFYDVLSPLQQQLNEVLKFTDTDYGFLVSSYSIPNVFLLMAVLGGIIADRLGIRITGTTFVSLMAAGAFITAYGSSDIFRNGGFGYGFMQSFWPKYSPELKMMTLGFFLFGFGAETSIVVISKIIVKWFKGKRLATAMAINLSLARLGSALAFSVSPFLITDKNWNLPIWFSVMLLLIGLLTFLIYVIQDVKFDTQIKDFKSEGLLSESKLVNLGADEEVPFRLKDLGRLISNPAFIFITLLCVTFYSAVFPFLKFAPNLFLNKWGMTEETSGLIASMLPWATIIFTPIFGLWADNKGKSASIMFFGSGMIILVHLLLGFTTLTPIVPMIIIGIAFSLVPAVMWPSVAKIVDTRRIGTAYGLMFSVQNLGLFFMPILIGTVLDAVNAENIAAGLPKDYTWPELIFAALGILGFFFAYMLKRSDKKHGFGLELPNVKE